MALLEQDDINGASGAGSDSYKLFCVETRFA